MTAHLPAQDSTSASTVFGAPIIEALKHNADVRADAPAMRHRVSGAWTTLTWRDYAQAVDEVVAGLAELGIGPGEAIGVLSACRRRSQGVCGG